LPFLLSPAAFSYPPLNVTVYTDRPSYSLGENVETYGQVTFEGAPVASAMVALEIRDPLSSPITARTVETNGSGIYDVLFTLGSENPLGTYTVHVSCSHDGEGASNSSTFDVEHVPSLVLTLETSNKTYKPSETIIVFGNLTYDYSPIQGVLVAVEVQDPEGTPIVIRVLETNEQGGYQLTLPLTYGSKTGEYRIYASATCNGTKIIKYTTVKLQTFSTDIDGDGRVDIMDLFLTARAWNTKPSDPRWDPRCDIDGNGEINIIDIYFVARDFGKTVS
jgi:uncharacterized protein YfaS (alpha-2-macroglobulin family)